MKSFLLAALGALAIVSLNGCYAEVAPYSYGTAYGAPAYYAPAPVYRTAYVAPAYQPAPRVYVAPARPMYRTAVLAPRYGRSW
jgi:hypothetical protein